LVRGQHESSRLRADTPGLNGPNAADTAIVTWRLEASLMSDCAAPKTVSAFGTNPNLPRRLRSGRYRVITRPSATRGQHCNSATPPATHSIRCNNLGPRPRPSWRAYPEITFLGYTLGQFYGKEGRPYIGTRPSRKAVKKGDHPDCADLRSRPQWCWIERPVEGVTLSGRLLLHRRGLQPRRRPPTNTSSHVALCWRRRIRPLGSARDSSSGE
jgi:hypothetical protein